MARPPNCAEWTVLQFASARTGAILVNINPAYRPAELAYALGQSGVRLLVMAESFKTSDYIAMLASVRHELPALSDATVRYHLRRWLRAGWARPQRALGRTWIIPTRRGLELAGSGYRPWTLVPSQLNHLHAVAVVRLAIETAAGLVGEFPGRKLSLKSRHVYRE